MVWTDCKDDSIVNVADSVEEGGAESRFCWILLGLSRKEAVEGMELGGGAHQDQSGWSKTTGATDL
ncbi:hypothetical protein PPACK8108_LOCUS18849 [Phakopsora pachyrhizi]|uniref:Uncharacterized protein n=1 Tax=Phakopsora pachyrhizi TaxID=170000 RepID=A0AAV0BB85_PHAPC|nr:hypothetical protein PPACK8108_LOCUS18849 [Phakopsora pachyrhizi]